MARPRTGQVLELDRAGGRTYAIRYRQNGQRKYETLGPEITTRAQAEAELANALADVRRGILRIPEPPPVVEERPMPSFHVFASEWVEGRRGEVEPRTVEHWGWALSLHLLPFFSAFAVARITPELVDMYKAAKLREREQGVVQRPLSNGSINKTLKVLAQVCDQAVEYGYLESNPAVGKRRRLKAARPKRTWLELDEVRAILDAAGAYRPLLATMLLSGLRVGEVTALRWRDVSLATGKLIVRKAKTDAGLREVDLSPDLLDELKAYKASARFDQSDDLVFPTSTGRPLNRSNVSNRILAKAIEKANATRAKVELPTIQDGITNHTLRRTFASLLYEAGASPAYVMSQMGHTSSALALEVYAKKMDRQRDTGARMDALVRGADWALSGSSDAEARNSLSLETTKAPR